VSNAADAYQKADLPVERVQRTVVFLKPDILIVLDHIQLSKPLSAQVRFQVYNGDDQGQATADKSGFTINRPHAALQARVATRQTRTIEVKYLPVGDDSAHYPLVEISCPESNTHEILTVCTAAPQGIGHGKLTVSHADGNWCISGSHLEQSVRVKLRTSVNDIPEIIL
ncbi:MAG: hypothetical protein K9M98_15730, partial [Cephaloticoccus sp.]|nr:hypothetical protein [Cephaloticoccus sp.]